MTLHGVIAAAILRKVKALVSEIRKLVAEATAVEKTIVAKAKADVESIYRAAKRAEGQIVTETTYETQRLKSELIDKIAKV